MELALRAEELARDVIAPLLTGGELVLHRPFGPKLALALGEGRTVVDNDLRTKIDDARLRVARSLVAVDALPPLSPAEWAMAAAVHDLLQVTNHELSSFATRGRHDDLLDATLELVQRIPPSATLEEALARHATFSRLLVLRRLDQKVSWWTGSESFRGQKPPARLLAWPGLRNVQVRTEAIDLIAMAGGTPLDEQRYLHLLDQLISCSPLTDLATSYRVTPTFVWSRHTLGVVATVAGGNLALRALSVAADDKPAAAISALTALGRAAKVLPEGPAQTIAEQYVAWLTEAKEHWADAG